MEANANIVDISNNEEELVNISDNEEEVIVIMLIFYCLSILNILMIMRVLLLIDQKSILMINQEEDEVEIVWENIISRQEVTSPLFLLFYIIFNFLSFPSIDLFQERVGILPEVIAIEVEVITIDGEEEVTIIFLGHSVNFKFQDGVEQVFEQEAPACPICLDTINIGDEVN